MKSITLLLLWLIILLMLFSGCESGRDKSVTGDFFDRKPGELKSISAGFDFIIAYRENIGEDTYTFAGAYSDVSAFSVFKFPIPSSEITDSLESATVKFNVSETWKNGAAEFGLYEAVSDWSDSVRLDKDLFLSNLGSPIAVFSDTAASIGSLDFALPPETLDNIRSWSTPGSFLIKNTDEGESMVGLTSVYSTDIPFIEYVIRTTEGTLDTTSTGCILSNYYFDTGFDPDKYSSGLTGIISDADNRAFVLKMSIPDSLPPTAAINKCIAKLKIMDCLAPSSDAFTVGFYQLTDSLTTFTDAEYEGDTVIEKVITEDLSSIEIDITSHLHTWHKIENSNFGILIKSLQKNSSPNQVIFAPEDSLTIIYTSLPEVE